jgi:hypothetical protein
MVETAFRCQPMAQRPFMAAAAAVVVGGLVAAAPQAKVAEVTAASERREDLTGRRKQEPQIPAAVVAAQAIRMLGQLVGLESL